MKMKKSLVALCLSAGLLACAPALTYADVNFVPQNTSAAPIRNHTLNVSLIINPPQFL